MCHGDDAIMPVAPPAKISAAQPIGALAEPEGAPAVSNGARAARLIVAVIAAFKGS